MIIMNPHIWSIARFELGGGSLPGAPKPPLPPMPSQAAQNVNNQNSSGRKAQGYSSTILTGNSSMPLPDNNVGKKTLLGG